MERLMQFVWQHRLGLRHDQQTVDGRRLRVIDQGTLNTDAGPDFFNATVEIGNETWVGNVEIHVRASDWFRHKHDTDPAYDSVILHVVQYDDMPITRKDSSVIPQLVMQCTPDAARRCNALLEYAQRALPCANTIKNIPHIYITDWITALASERLFRKSERIMQLVEENSGYWESAAYITLARALGFGLNSLPFEMLAKSLPLQFLNRHHDELITTEALIFGQAGMIPPPDNNEEPYITNLRTEYDFMVHKFSLKPVQLSWKMARTRPQNFPHRRLALLAQMVHKGFYLTGDLADATDLTEMRRLFDVELIGFWANHYTFSSKGGCNSHALSKSSINTLLINVAIPLLHARAAAKGDFEAIERYLEMLQNLDAENNSVVRLFGDAGIECKNAFTSQALVELRREYCEKKKCIFCRWGHKMLSQEIQR